MAALATVTLPRPEGPPDLSDRVILITGAGSGIGRAVALAAAPLGAQLLLLGRNTLHLEGLYDELLSSGAPRPSVVPFDLAAAGEAAYAELAELIAAEFGRLDGLLHNAGSLDRLSPVEHWRFEDWHRILQVNLNARYALTRALLPQLRAAGDAAIVFSSSRAASEPTAHWGAYATSLAASDALAAVLAGELGPPQGPRVHAIAPGPVATGLRRRAFPGEGKDVAAAPAEVAWAYLELLSRRGAPYHGQRVTLAE